MNKITINNKEFDVRAHTFEEDLEEAERLVLLQNAYDTDNGLYCRRPGGRIAKCKELCAYLLDTSEVNFEDMTLDEFYNEYDAYEVMREMKACAAYRRIDILMEDVDTMLRDYNYHVYSSGFQLKRIGDLLEDINTNTDAMLDAEQLGNLLAEAGIGNKNKKVRPIDGPFNFSKVK